MIRIWDFKLAGAPPLLSGVVRRRRACEVTTVEEFELRLVSVGPHRLEVIRLVSRSLQLSSAEARRRIDRGEVLLAKGMGHLFPPLRLAELHDEFGRLGASTRLVRIERHAEPNTTGDSGGV
jgi:hypothetical protein